MISRLRYSLLIVVLGIAVLSGGTPSWASDEDEKRATQLAENALAHRRKIESGDFRLDSRVIFYRDGKPDREKHVQIDLWLDGTSRRADYHRHGDGEEIIGDYRDSVTITDDLLLYYNDQRFSDGSHQGNRCARRYGVY